MSHLAARPEPAEPFEATRQRAGRYLEFALGDTEYGLEIDEQSVEDPPAFGLATDTEFVLGMGKLGSRVSILLDIDNVFGSAEIPAIRSIDEHPAADRGASGTRAEA